MDRVSHVGLVKIELRGGPVVRLCDGGFVTFAGELYQSSDDSFGTIGALEPISEGVGDEAPAFRMTFYPKDTTAAAVLSSPGYQGSRIRFWIGEVDEATGTMIGTPGQLVEAMTDATTLTVGRGTRSLQMDCVATAERLFLKNEGNSLSSRFHRSIFANEAGMDNATGVQVAVAWGVSGPPRGSTYGGGGGYYRAGGSLEDRGAVRNV
jgi:hypothetical protein